MGGLGIRSTTFLHNPDFINLKQTKYLLIFTLLSKRLDTIEAKNRIKLKQYVLLSHPEYD